MSDSANLPNRRSIRLKGYDYSCSGLYFVTICVQDRVSLFGKIEDGEMLLNEFGNIASNELLRTSEIRENVTIDSYVVMPNHVHFIIHILHDSPRRGEWNSPENIAGESGEKVEPNSNTGKCGSAQRDSSAQRDKITGECGSPQPDNITGECGSAQRDSSSQPDNITGECGSAQRDKITGECNSPLQTPLLRTPLRSPQGTVGSIVRGYKSAVTRQLMALGFTGKLWQRNYYEHIIRTPASHARIVNYIKTNPDRWSEDRFRS